MGGKLWKLYNVPGLNINSFVHKFYQSDLIIIPILQKKNVYSKKLNYLAEVPQL